MCAQVFHTDSLIYYAEQKASGREWPKSLVPDDIHQVCYELVLWCGEAAESVKFPNLLIYLLSSVDLVERQD